MHFANNQRQRGISLEPTTLSPPFCILKYPTHQFSLSTLMLKNKVTAHFTLSCNKNEMITLHTLEMTWHKRNKVNILDSFLWPTLFDLLA